MHPRDARAMLTRYARRRAKVEAQLEQARVELPDIVGRALDAELSKSEIARIVGVSRETVNRVAAKLERPSMNGPEPDA
jgi:hypothetical protein